MNRRDLFRFGGAALAAAVLPIPLKVNAEEFFYARGVVLGPSLHLTLIEWAKHHRMKRAVSAFVAEIDVLKSIPFQEIEGDHYTYTPSVSLSRLEQRP